MLRRRARELSLDFTFHRAFDYCRDGPEAIETLLKLDVPRVLTSGMAPTAAAGAERLAALVAIAGFRLAVVAGGGVTPANAAELARTTGVRELHGSASKARGSGMAWRPEGLTLAGMGGEGWSRKVTDVGTVASILREAAEGAVRRAAGSHGSK